MSGLGSIVSATKSDNEDLGTCPALEFKDCLQPPVHKVFSFQFHVDSSARSYHRALLNVSE